MTAATYRAHHAGSVTNGDNGKGLAPVVAGAGASGLLALATLISGGGLFAAFLVYVLGASALVPVLAGAPYARRAATVVRNRASSTWLTRQHS